MILIVIAARAKMSLRMAQNIFMPKNINSIVIFLFFNLAPPGLFSAEERTEKSRGNDVALNKISATVTTYDGVMPRIA